MGEIIGIKCKSCKADWECILGCGMWDDFDDAVNSYPKEVRKEIYDSVTGEEPTFDFGYGLARCTHCRKMVSVPVLELKDTQKEYIGMCGECGREVELVQNLSQTPCPVCEKVSLEEEEVGLWD